MKMYWIAPGYRKPVEEEVLSADELFVYPEVGRKENRCGASRQWYADRVSAESALRLRMRASNSGGTGCV